MTKQIQHFGVKGMKWGERRSGNPSVRKGKRFTIDPHKKYDGRTLADDVLNDIGTLAVSRLVGGYLISQGKIEVGGLLRTMGTSYAIGSAAGNVIIRTTRND